MKKNWKKKKKRKKKGEVGSSAKKTVKQPSVMSSKFLWSLATDWIEVKWGRKCEKVRRERRGFCERGF